MSVPPAPVGARPASGPVPVLVVPCYNEAQRLDRPALRRLAEGGSLQLLLVNDGSRDATAAALAEVAAGTTAQVLDLATNAGKGEAVRHGLLKALADGATIVGYFDADLATPPSELQRLIDTLVEREDVEVAMGCRVARLGSIIDRSVTRHYLGRVFASAASLALGCQVYDTQCGAKVFRATPALSGALERPFGSPWAFDVTLLRRLLSGDGHRPAVAPAAMVEVPLGEWRERGGSRLDVGSMIRAFAAVLAMIVRRALRRPPP
ncbi:MAG: glycosyltransferase [Acidimicrobiales bacterium]